MEDRTDLREKAADELWGSGEFQSNPEIAVLPEIVLGLASS